MQQPFSRHLVEWALIIRHPDSMIHTYATSDWMILRIEKCGAIYSTTYEPLCRRQRTRYPAAPNPGDCAETTMILDTCCLRSIRVLLDRRISRESGMVLTHPFVPADQLSERAPVPAVHTPTRQHGGDTSLSSKHQQPTPYNLLIRGSLLGVLRHSH